MRRSSSKGGLRLERKNAVGGGKKGSSRRVSSYVETLKTPKGFSIHLHGGCNLYKLKCDSRWRNRGRRTFYSASFIRATHKRRFRRFFHPMKLLCGACRRLCVRIGRERERRKKRKRERGIKFRFRIISVEIQQFAIQISGSIICFFFFFS